MILLEFQNGNQLNLINRYYRSPYLLIKRFNQKNYAPRAPI